MKNIGVILVDHGSRRPESNQAFLEIVSAFAARSPYPIVEAAHMECAPPTIGEAFDSAVARGAEEIVVHPYFLLPGKHWALDIPALVAQAAKNHPGKTWKVTEPLGASEKIRDVILERISAALENRR